MASQISYQCLNQAGRVLCLRTASSNIMVNGKRKMSSLLSSSRSSKQGRGRPSLTVISNLQFPICQQLHITPPVRDSNKIKINVKTDTGTVTLECKEGDSILDLINNNNFEIPGYGSCEGTIACSTCHVVLSQPDYDAHKKGITVDELDLLDMVTEATDTRGRRHYSTAASTTPPALGSHITDPTETPASTSTSGSDPKVLNRIARPAALSLAGSGFLAPYLLGAVTALDLYPWKAESLKDGSTAGEDVQQGEQGLRFIPESVAGASAGSLLAAALLAGSPSRTALWDTFETAAEDSSHRLLGPFSRKIVMENYIRHCMEGLPADAHQLLRGRLFISLTHLNTFKNRMVSEWQSREDLIKCLLCSCYIPVFSGGDVPVFEGEQYIDGGFTNNQPKPFASYLSISPFAGGAHVCPRDEVKNPRYVQVANESILVTKKNLERLYRALVPYDKAVFRSLQNDGYEDTMHYLQCQELKEQ